MEIDRVLVSPYKRWLAWMLLIDLLENSEIRDHLIHGLKRFHQCNKILCLFSFSKHAAFMNIVVAKIYMELKESAKEIKIIFLIKCYKLRFSIRDMCHWI
jgi:hypothetical protein